MGLASHVGLILKTPTIGIAKKLLTGRINWRENRRTGEIILNGEIRGFAVKTRSKGKPIYVSPGNLITLEESLKITLSNTLKTRLPAPLHKAHVLSTQMKNKL